MQRGVYPERVSDIVNVGAYPEIDSAGCFNKPIKNTLMFVCSSCCCNGEGVTPGGMCSDLIS